MEPAHRLSIKGRTLAHAGLLAGLTETIFFGGNLLGLALGDSRLLVLLAEHGVGRFPALAVLLLQSAAGMVLAWGSLNLLRGKGQALALTGYLLSAPLWLYGLAEHLLSGAPLAQAGELIALNLFCMIMPALLLFSHPKSMPGATKRPSRRP
ncbi:MAG: hypothetical protein V3573_12200 [Desulfovibrionaceae bacterium]